MKKLNNRNSLEANVGGNVVNQWGSFKRNKKDIVTRFLDNEGREYTIAKNLDGFYNKALIYQNVNDLSNYILISYNTIVAEIQNNYFIIYGYWSETTKRHINAFLNRYGLETFCKKEILQIENEWKNCKDFIQ